MIKGSKFQDVRCKSQEWLCFKDLTESSTPVTWKYNHETH